MKASDRPTPAPMTTYLASIINHVAANAPPSVTPRHLAGVLAALAGYFFAASKPSAMDTLVICAALVRARSTKAREPLFTCPVCGSHAFGSSELAPGIYERQCHGRADDQPCHVAWPDLLDAIFLRRPPGERTNEAVSGQTIVTERVVS